MADNARESVLEQIPAGRLGTTEEVADAAMFLAVNRLANGTQVVLDGGLSAT